MTVAQSNKMKISAATVNNDRDLDEEHELGTRLGDVVETSNVIPVIPREGNNRCESKKGAEEQLPYSQLLVAWLVDSGEAQEKCSQSMRSEIGRKNRLNTKSMSA